LCFGVLPEYWFLFGAIDKQKQNEFTQKEKKKTHTQKKNNKNKIKEIK
jgi:hypothetical protein